MKQKILLERGKILLIMLFSSFFFAVKDLFTVSVVFLSILVFALVFFWGKTLKNQLIPLITIGISVIVFQLLFNTTTEVYVRIKEGIIACEKIISLSLLVFIYVRSTSMSTIIEVFSFFPKKIQLMLAITLSMLSVTFTEMKKIMLIQSARGHNFKSFNIFAGFIPLIIPLLHRTLQRSEQIAIVIHSRGYEE